jgi:predicted DNA-binding WGR domain protein
MDNLLTATFEAHHGGKNHHRRYEVTVGRDLFDDWTVAIRYGRIGPPGQERRYVSPKLAISLCWSLSRVPSIEAAAVSTAAALFARSPAPLACFDSFSCFSIRGGAGGDNRGNTQK